MKLKYLEMMVAVAECRRAEAAFTLAKQRMEELKADFLICMETIGTTTYNGPSGTVSLLETTMPVIESWEDLTNHMLEAGDLDLLQRRISVTNYRDRIEAGLRTPGVSTFIKKSLRVS